MPHRNIIKLTLYPFIQCKVVLLWAHAKPASNTHAPTPPHLRSVTVPSWYIRKCSAYSVLEPKNAIWRAMSPRNSDQH